MGISRVGVGDARAQILESSDQWSSVVVVLNGMEGLLII
jgi:hypothetical protein